MKLSIDIVHKADLEQHAKQYWHDTLLLSKTVATKLELMSQIQKHFENREKTVLRKTSII